MNKYDRSHCITVLTSGEIDTVSGGGWFGAIIGLVVGVVGGAVVGTVMSGPGVGTIGGAIMAGTVGFSVGLEK